MTRQRLRDDYERQGFVVLRRAVPPHVVHRFRSELASRAETTWTQLRTAPVDDRGIVRLRALSYQCPAFRQICHGAALRYALRVLLGTSELYVHPRRFLRLNPPGGRANKSFRPHQDHAAVKGSPAAITVWIPLHRCHTGGIALAGGSHRDGLFDVRADSFGALPYRIADPMGFVTKTESLEMGDAMLLHCHTVHATAANRSHRVRFSIDFRVQPAAEPLHASQLLPCIAVDESLRAAPHLWTGDPCARVPARTALVDDEERDTEKAVA